MTLKKIDARRPLLTQLQEANIELDQRMRSAIQMRLDDNLTDDQVFYSLYKLNSVVSRHLELKERHVWPANLRLPSEGPGYSTYLPVDRVRISGNKGAHRVFDRALELVGDGNTLGVYHFVKALVELGLKYGESYVNRPYSVDMLCRALDQNAATPLSESRQAVALLQTLSRSIDGSEDFQYIMGLEEGRIVFRVSSVLDDYVQPSDSGVLGIQRAILTHFKDSFGGFSEDEIRELEDLVNNPKSREIDFQRFFQCNPHFFRRWDYREVHPQVYLAKSSEQLIPDFILTDRTLQRAAIVELKLPKPKLIRRQHNRDRFSDAIMEARAQLLKYRGWFRDSHNRRELKKIVGMEIYEPHLAVIIGRTSEFRDEMDRQLLVSENKDIEVVTYDDILTHAERRKLIIRPD
jgi:hypothetical protein